MKKSSEISRGSGGPDRQVLDEIPPSPRRRISPAKLVQENEALRIQLAEAQETLRAIHEGEVDAIVVSGSHGNQVFSLTGVESVYRLIVETMRETAFTVAFDGTILFANAQFAECLKRPMKEILGHTLHEFVVASHRAEVKLLLSTSHSRPSKSRLVFRSADGTPVPAYVSSNLLSQSNGGSICMVVTDLTELESSSHLIQALRRQEDVLRESELRYRTVAENTTGFEFWINPEGHYLYASPSCKQICGYDAAEFLANPSLKRDLVHPDDLARFDLHSAEETKLQAGEIEFRIVRPDGSVRWVHHICQPVFDEKAGYLGVRGSSRDITEHRQAEEALSRSAARMLLLSNCSSRLLASPDPQSVVNELCREVMAHLDCQAFFNFLADEGAGKLHLNAYAGIPEEEARKIEWLDYGVAVCGCAAQQACRIVAEDIANVPDPRTDLVQTFGIQAYCCHPLVTQGRVIGTISFGTTTRSHFAPDEVEVMRTVADQVAIAMQRVINLQALKILNESLEQRVAEQTAEVRHQSQRLRVLAAELSQTEQRERKRLAAVLHDHIQQLLVAAQIHLDFVKQADSAAIGPAVQGVESIIREAIDASRSLAVDLSPPILHLSGLGPALGWLANRMDEKNLFKVRVRADSEAEPSSEPMRLLLFESVRELLLNAVKHSGAREASVTMERATDGWTKITIEDKGGGFDPQAVREHRNGLGLFGIQQRLMYLGGKMEVESTPGVGTRVILLAPTEKASEGTPAAAVQEVRDREFPSPSAKQKRINILLVDDHRIVRQGLSNLLQLEPDLEVVAEAEDGAQALEFARRWKPDVVVTDVSMPGMDGVELTRRLLREMPGIKILGLSMHIEKDIAAAMREAGAIGYLTKGGLSEDLIAAIRACVPRA